MPTEARIDTIFKEMNSYVLELASEPGMLGPQYFQDIIAKCRGYLNNVSLVISELNREKLTLSSELRKLEALYELEYDNLLANDENVRRLANIEDRKSTANFHLRRQRQEMTIIKDQLHSVDSVSKVVAHRSRELHATMNAIKDQRRLMQTELSTGAFYGDERTSKGKDKLPSVEDDISVEELALLMQDPVSEPAKVREPDPVVKEPDPDNSPILQEKASEANLLQEKVPVAAQVVADAPPTEEEILSFLEAGVPPDPQSVGSKPFSDDPDLQAILEGL
jgi:hypothetical protein